ncbi:hypothetical protein DY000_02010837 [Brassica cretica]|uniref:Uncharacterized protein n=1 Tax=Brassica cretica TaxID=69181 RepID=A0ABQ7CPD0_BRACR|nr:hypothetical protein DY000_02010837 [Brassica cretica]
MNLLISTARSYLRRLSQLQPQLPSSFSLKFPIHSVCVSGHRFSSATETISHHNNLTPDSRINQATVLLLNQTQG